MVDPLNLYPAQELAKTCSRQTPHLVTVVPAVDLGSRRQLAVQEYSIRHGGCSKVGGFWTAVNLDDVIARQDGHSTITEGAELSLSALVLHGIHLRNEKERKMYHQVSMA